LLLGAVAHAGFSPARQVSEAGRAVGRCDIGIDHFGNLVLAYEEEGRVVVYTRGPAQEDWTTLGEGKEPRLTFSSISTLVAYSAPDASGAGHRIVVRRRAGPHWSDGEVWSDADGDDRLACLSATEAGEPVLAWERRREAAPARIYFRRAGLPPVDLGRGEKPALVLDGSGRAHVLFLRDDDIHGTRESAVQPARFPHATNVTMTPFVVESAPRAAVTADSIVFLCFERTGEIFLANDGEGDLSRASSVAANAVEPSLAISPNGALALAYASAGDIHSVLGTAHAAIPEGKPIQQSPEEESEALVAVDSFANVFVAFKRGGSLFHATDAGLPQAAFEADRLAGEAPLTVAFRDRSTGDVTGWSWDFGDGDSSSDRSPVHTYTRSGEHVVRLRVSGPGGESPLSHRRTILVQDASNEMRIAPVSVFPGQQGVHVPILATHDRPAQGFTVAAVYDPTFLRLQHVKFEQSNIAGLDPELFVVTITEDPEDAYFTAGILFDIVDPFDGRTILPGRDHRIANIVADVSASARPGSVTRIALRNQIGKPPLNNIFTVNGFSILPVLGEEATVTIRKLTFPPPRFFIRGDTDLSGTVSLTDAVLILGYLFSGGVDLACADAADMSDDGLLDVSDAVYLLNFLFKSASYPAPPFPDPGLDATDDLLPECRLR
jgi:PKD repeat protein